MASNINSVSSGSSGFEQSYDTDAENELLILKEKAGKLGLTEDEYVVFEQLASREGLTVEEYKRNDDSIKENFNSLLSKQASDFNKYILDLAKKQQEEEDSINKNA